VLSIARILERPAWYVKKYGVDTDYLPLVKNQNSEGLCWVFAAMAHVEIEYGLLTGNRIRLSSEQVSNGYNDYFDSSINVAWWILSNDTQRMRCTSESSYDPRNGGISACSLLYTMYYGAMFEYDYPYMNGTSINKYSSGKVSHARVNAVEEVRYVSENITYYFHPNGDVEVLPRCTLDYHKYLVTRFLSTNHSLFIEINADAFDYRNIVDWNVVTNVSNHAVVATSIGCINDGTHDPNDLYMEVFNSWGTTGASGTGLYYIKIYDHKTGEIWNNMNVFANYGYAHVSHDAFNDINPFSTLLWSIASIVLFIYFIRLHSSWCRDCCDDNCCLSRCCCCGFCHNRIIRDVADVNKVLEQEAIEQSIIP